MIRVEYTEIRRVLHIDIDNNYKITNKVYINGLEYADWYFIPLEVRNTIPTEKYIVVYDWLIANVMPNEKENKNV